MNLGSKNLGSHNEALAIKMTPVQLAAGAPKIQQGHLVLGRVLCRLVEREISRASP
jgi:hypothetical protein